MTAATAIPTRWPTMREEAKVRRLYVDHNGKPNRKEIARKVQLPLNLIDAIIKWHRLTIVPTSANGPYWYGEQYVPEGMVVRCPLCRNRLAVWIPKHDLLGCRECRLKEKT